MKKKGMIAGAVILLVIAAVVLGFYFKKTASEETASKDTESRVEQTGDDIKIAETDKKQETGEAGEEKENGTAADGSAQTESGKQEQNSRQETSAGETENKETVNVSSGTGVEQDNRGSDKDKPAGSEQISSGKDISDKENPVTEKTSDSEKGTGQPQSTPVKETPKATEEDNISIGPANGDKGNWSQIVK